MLSRPLRLHIAKLSVKDNALASVVCPCHPLFVRAVHPRRERLSTSIIGYNAKPVASLRRTYSSTSKATANASTSSVENDRSIPTLQSYVTEDSRQTQSLAHPEFNSPMEYLEALEIQLHSAKADAQNAGYSTTEIDEALSELAEEKKRISTLSPDDLAKAIGDDTKQRTRPESWENTPPLLQQSEALDSISDPIDVKDLLELGIPTVQAPVAVPWHPSHIKDPTKLPRRINSLSDLGPNFTEEEYASALVHGRSVHMPFIHPRTHSIPVASLVFRSHHPRLLDLATHVALHAASSLGIPCSRTAMLPEQRRLWTVLKSPFIFKKSQENFERRVKGRLIKAWDADDEVVDHWVQYLAKHIVPGVGLKVTRWRRVEVGFGRNRMNMTEGFIETSGLQRSQGPAAKKIEHLSERIVSEEMRVASSAKDPRAVTSNHRGKSS